MKNLIFIQLLILYLAGTVSAQSTKTINSKFFSESKNDTIEVLFHVEIPTDFHVKDSLFFYEIRQGIKTIMTGALEMKRCAGKNVINFRLPFNPNWKMRKPECFDLVYQYTYDPVMGKIDNVSCKSLKSVAAVERFDIEAAIGAILSDVVNFID